MAIDKKRRYTWDGTERDYTLPAVLRDIAKLDYAGFECTDGDVAVYESDMQGFRRAVKTSGLEFVSTWSTLFPKKLPKSFRTVVTDVTLPISDPSQYLPISIKKLDESQMKGELKRQMEFGKFAGRLGARLLTVGGPYIAEADFRDGYYKIMGEVLNDFGEQLQKDGMRIAYHPEGGTMVRTSEEVDRLFEYADKGLVHLCLETAHLTAFGGDSVKFVSKYTNRIIHVHFKDLAKGTFAELGTGVVDFKGIVKALRAFGYDGWVMAELDFPPGAPFDSAVRNKKYLDKVVGKEKV